MSKAARHRPNRYHNSPYQDNTNKNNSNRQYNSNNKQSYHNNNNNSRPYHNNNNNNNNNNNRSYHNNNRPFQHNNKTFKKQGFQYQPNKKYADYKMNHVDTTKPIISKQQPPIKLLPLPKGPLFQKSTLTPQWKQLRAIGPGFVNGQNTCFLNSVLECLTYTPSLAQYFLEQDHKKHCKINHFCTMCAMQDHIYRCFRDSKSFKKGSAILPRAFTTNLRFFSKTLQLGRQEDAHEFMMFLLDAMHKSTIHGYEKVDAKKESTAFIYQIFGGKLRSQLKCHSCHAKSNTFDNFLDLSVDLTLGNSVKEALENFIKVDMIGGSDPDSKYKCESCKQKVNAGKQMTIHQLPSTLSIHLKRFAFDLNYGYMRKVTKFIHYSESLNMKPYISKGSQDTNLNTNYQLYAVLVHSGYGCDSGHYYAYVKAPNGKWYCMDDDDVSPVSLKEVLSQQAYMLFYNTTTKVDTKLNIDDIPNNINNINNNELKRKLSEIEDEKDKENENISSIKPSNKSTIINNEKKETKLIPEVKKKKNEINMIGSHQKEKELTSASLSASASESDESDHSPPSPISTNINDILYGRNTWLIQSSDKPYRSLRGQLSPPTFAAAISDTSAWTVRDISEPSYETRPIDEITKNRIKGWKVKNQVM